MTIRQVGVCAGFRVVGLNQVGAADAGRTGGLDVAGFVADQQRGGQRKIQFASGPQDHAGRRLAAVAVDAQVCHAARGVVCGQW